MDKLDKYEKEILESYENDEWISVENLEERIKNIEDTKLRGVKDTSGRFVQTKDIKTVEMGWPLGMPLVKNIGKGIWEVRINFRNGIARILFKMFEKQMVLLHGFIKKSQKTPSNDLEIAFKRAKTLR